ncbi:MAG TPA: hypothetical protein VIK02_07385 [Candidatus Anoxymicrobiaceae bacterium]
MNESVRRVEIFLGPVACSCSGMPSPAKLEKIEKALNLKRSLEKDYGDAFKVKTWDLGDDSCYEEGLKVLARYLREAGEIELAAGLAFAVNDATPSIAVDGKITWIRDCPETADFLDRFGTTAKNKQSLGLRR